ncbi:RNA polymerase sigma factor [Simiduia curdlanivorans]|uniref:RNA polymerase sigma factor n=1 Tax=Simiduia curdlanivorans TaxID=1492769 RepID=A0ABV8V8U0_9GAMM|nr:RNA polymerase sigma factor [Simiduia curdlanivorans]MDN3638826.1 RNA polymerase sigma factor [Simiduia curdlanivorans]
MTYSNIVDNTVSNLYKQHSRKVLATLVRLLGDFDLAEEAAHEAFALAIETWRSDGIPDNPTAWLISTGRFKAIDIIRRNQRFGALQPDLQQLVSDIEAHNLSLSQRDIEDDQLRLIFTCCHPAIDAKVQIPLTLREVCGLTTEEIASAFLVPASTMAQRIVRGKNKIREAKIPFVIPEATELPERLDAVLSVIYLVFNEGYSASSGDALTRADLSNEALRLCRLLLNLLPDAEVMGLLALMLLHESRRSARTDDLGDIVLLEDQDRSLWDKGSISEGVALVRQALLSRRFGFYSLQAAIAAVHAESASASDTDWHQIVSLYDVLLRVEPSPIIELNRAVAVAMRDGPEAGVQLIDGILKRGELADYHLLHSSRGELLRRCGQHTLALAAFELALALAKQAPEKRLIQAKITQLQSD